VGRRSGLGRGLGALLPEANEQTPEGAELLEVPVEAVQPNRYQPRATFDEQALESLTASIGELGVLQPILVRPSEGGGYELIAGERRWRAAQRAGLATIPALVRTIEDTVSLEQALVENLHREDLNPMEEAAGYQQLLDDFSLTQEQVASRVGKSRSAVANTIRLLHLPPPIQAMVVDRRLSAGHARALLAVEDGPEQEQLADRIVAEELTVRETEEAVRRLVAAHFAGDDADTDRPQVPARPAALLELEQLLSELLDTKVQVTMGGRRGKVVVDFATIEDLERIYRVIIEGKPTVE
jgi:ParB family chromosome partitioning protein